MSEFYICKKQLYGLKAKSALRIYVKRRYYTLSWNDRRAVVVLYLKALRGARKTPIMLPLRFEPATLLFVKISLYSAGSFNHYTAQVSSIVLFRKPQRI